MDPYGARPPEVTFQRSPDSYRHWTLRVEEPVARLELCVAEDGGLVPGYELKLNSYDLGVDIELYDALQRLRFEHPGVRSVVLTSARDGVFCAGANIRMLAASSHAWKVNFCKFTNETRNGMEDASAHSGLTFLAAVNGSCAGGGYELALACDHIVLVDDNASTVALPEVSLLGVLPGTGGLTRLVDKRRVRKDLADVFATRSDGVKGRTAVEWRLVDETVPRRDFAATVERRAREAAARGTPRAGAGARGIALTPLRCETTDVSLEYRCVRAALDRSRGLVTVTVHGPADEAPSGPADVHARGDTAWLLAVTRELDDLVLRLRTNEPELGTWVLRTEGEAERVLAHERAVLDAAHTDAEASVETDADTAWLCREIAHYYKRTLKRLDVTSRSLVALIEPGSCFAGVLLELALACDVQYMLDGQPVADPDSAERALLTLSGANFGALPMGNGLSRLESRFYRDPEHLARLRDVRGEPLTAARARDLGLVTDAPDDLDWEDAVRIALEARAALSPDALTGMEANHRFVGPETVETKIFGRLSAWQNWIFDRPNASGPEGALRRYGTGRKAAFDRKRV